MKLSLPNSLYAKSNCCFKKLSINLYSSLDKALNL